MMDCNTQNEDVSHINLNESEKVPEGWTKHDKYELLQALKIYGSHNCEQIQTYLPSKSIDEINEMINYYKRKAFHHPMLNEEKKNKKLINNISKVPLGMWAKFLTDSLNYNELETEMATALRLIAELENIPTPMCTNNIDFREIYHVIANALEGKTLSDNPVINSLLEKCIVETAYTSKSFIRNSSLKNIIDAVDLSDKGVNVFPRPTENNELSTLRQLIVQKNYNPLDIPEEYLKPSMHKNNSLVFSSD